MALLLQILRTTGFVGVTVFIGAYWILAPWWRSEMGRNIMGWAIAAWLLGVTSILSQLFGPPGIPMPDYYFGHSFIRLIAWLLFNVIVWQRIVILLREHRTR